MTWAVAFSGGPDSTALGAALARQQANGWAFIVDHGLRPGSALEAETAAARAVDLGYQAEVLRWQGEKPATGLMEAAREARYRLLLDACRRHGCSRLFLGHQRDDQIETALFRLSRQSGWRGMAGMPRAVRRGGVELLRPFLDLPKAELIAFCRARGLAYADDPSNRNPRFQRARFRLADGFARTGFDATALAGSLTVWRDRRQDELVQLRALEGEVWQIPPKAALACVNLERLAALEQDARDELLLNLAQTIGQATYRTANAARSRLLQDRPGWTLMGCCWTRRGRELLITREPGACAALELPAGKHELYWDRRFDLTLTLDAPARLAALGDGAWRGVAGTLELADIPAPARKAMPALWRAGKVVAVLTGSWRPLYQPLTQNFSPESANEWLSGML